MWSRLCGCCPSILAKLGAAGAGGFWARYYLENINDALNDSNNTALTAAILDTKQICLDVVVKLPLQKKNKLNRSTSSFF